MCKNVDICRYPIYWKTNMPSLLLWFGSWTDRWDFFVHCLSSLTYSVAHITLTSIHSAAYLFLCITVGSLGQFILHSITFMVLLSPFISNRWLEAAHFIFYTHWGNWVALFGKPFSLINDWWLEEVRSHLVHQIYIDLYIVGCQAHPALRILAMH